MNLHLNADLQARYHRFVERVRTSGELWVLIGPEARGAWVESNHYVTEDDEPIPVHLVYSAAAYARQHATGAWAAYEPAALEVDQFLAGPLQHMHQSGEMLGPDYNADLAGVEIEPIDLARALLGEEQP
ncbi:DUF2750 domain-containing protein [Mycobacterium marinum]|uniref:DUF2750 domain-containing protein n=1 Tax=Mycobacterium marinum TaxID=1781 RepID=UPI0004274D94|nr:DUF2750 domain-containing protein [Mycobacterium marinum]MDC8974686.1 DUF2750 domain-containing protein [Mycobacterium marinum]MDC9003121.1 DUF2750 domain-containing protein [Mycobacterium marinum]QQW34817.1 DUF2750 domain-containing protein [Mycobacterium marinum]RFZ58907.1 hypothetical protein MSS2_00594 [Mycobacterium marinum]GJO52523.1 hypothetical protein NJB1604_42260 [Mycobacterium marinum]